MDRRCKSCSATIGQEQRFCTSCGTKIHLATEAETLEDYKINDLSTEAKHDSSRISSWQAFNLRSVSAAFLASFFSFILIAILIMWGGISQSYYALIEIRYEETGSHDTWASFEQAVLAYFTLGVIILIIMEKFGMFKHVSPLFKNTKLYFFWVSITAIIIVFIQAAPNFLLGHQAFDFMYNWAWYVLGPEVSLHEGLATWIFWNIFFHLATALALCGISARLMYK
jgi:hypothetical protein